MSQIQQGTYIAKAIKPAALEKSPEKGTPCVRVTFKLADGGATIDWVGWLTEKTRDRTVESLEYMGFDGTDLETVTKNDVQIVIEPEEYENDKGEKKTTMRVKWVNSLGGRGMSALDAAEEQRIRQDLRGLLLGRQSNTTSKPAPAPAPMGGTSFPFGANAPDAGGRDVKFGVPGK